MELSQQGYKHEVSSLLSDFLSYIIYYFSSDLEGLEQLNKRYNKEEIKKMQGLLCEFMLVHNREQQYNEGLFAWNDFLGEYYQVLAGKYRKSALGQYFTPEPICDFMSKISGVESTTDEIITINDPACGSGRMLLAGHCHAKGKCRVYGEDLDEICVKMTVVNLLIHGVEGEVLHHNSLSQPDSFYTGYYVNEHIKYALLPTVRKLKSPDESFICQLWKNRKEKLSEEEYKKEVEIHKEIIQRAPHLDWKQYQVEF